MDNLISRNIEFQRLLVEYQQKVRESSDSIQVAEELSRKLSMEVSFIFLPLLISVDGNIVTWPVIFLLVLIASYYAGICLETRKGNFNEL